MYPSQSRLITAPVDFSASGDNTIINNPPTDNTWIYVKQIQVMPEAAVRMTFKAKNLVTSAERAFTADTLFQNGQGFVFESFDAQTPYLFELRPGESLVCNLDTSAACNGFVNYTKHIG